MKHEMLFEGDATSKKERMSKKPSAARSKAMEKVKKGMKLSRCEDCGKVSCHCK